MSSAAPALPVIARGSFRGIGYIYFMLAEQNLIRPMLKIGFSLRGPDDRLRNCRTGSPVQLNMIAFQTGRLVDERKLHRRFSEHRSHGEWFYYEGPLREYVEEIIS